MIDVDLSNYIFFHLILIKTTPIYIYLTLNESLKHMGISSFSFQSAISWNQRVPSPLRNIHIYTHLPQYYLSHGLLFGKRNKWVPSKALILTKALFFTFCCVSKKSLPIPISLFQWNMCLYGGLCVDALAVWFWCFGYHPPLFFVLFS